MRFPDGIDGKKNALFGAFPLVCLLLSACGAGSTAGVQTEARDSAGVTIVESSGLPAHGAGGWVLGQNSELSIGTLDGDTLYQLFRVSDGILLPDGRIVVSENGRLQLRVFGADGVFQSSLGREGEGPGRWVPANLHQLPVRHSRGAGEALLR
jgi:hypothetical protein